jgi:hypothetical protein
MANREEIEILISEDGDDMQVRAHNFHGNGCKALVEAFQFGKVTKAGPTGDYHKSQSAQKPIPQKR